MTLTACSLLVAAALSTGTPATPSAATVAESVPASPLAAAAQKSVVAPDGADARLARLDGRPFTVSARRPGVLPAFYASLAALQVADVYSTRRAIGGGAAEANPLMRKASASSGAMVAMKAASTAGAIYFTERAWKKSRKGAIILMAAINGVTAAVVANNLRNAR
jgi:uncharacterized membrane protein